MRKEAYEQSTHTQYPSGYILKINEKKIKRWTTIVVVLRVKSYFSSRYEIYFVRFSLFGFPFVAIALSSFSFFISASSLPFILRHFCFSQTYISFAVSLWFDWKKPLMRDYFCEIMEMIGLKIIIIIFICVLEATTCCYCCLLSERLRTLGAVLFCLIESSEKWSSIQKAFIFSRFIWLL